MKFIVALVSSLKLDFVATFVIQRWNEMSTLKDLIFDSWHHLTMVSLLNIDKWDLIERKTTDISNIYVFTCDNFSIKFIIILKPDNGKH